MNNAACGTLVVGSTTESDMNYYIYKRHINKFTWTSTLRHFMPIKTRLQRRNPGMPLMIHQLRLLHPLPRILLILHNKRKACYNQLFPFLQHHQLQAQIPNRSPSQGGEPNCRHDEPLNMAHRIGVGCAVRWFREGGEQKETTDYKVDNGVQRFNPGLEAGLRRPGSWFV